MIGKERYGRRERMKRQSLAGKKEIKRMDGGIRRQTTDTRREEKKGKSGIRRRSLCLCLDFAGS